MDRLTRDQIEALYKRYHDRLLTIARTLLGNDDEARDVVSDVFVELLAKGKTPDEGQARNYLTVCVRNKCLNLLEHKRIVKKSATELPADLEDAEYEEPPVDEVIDYVNTQLKPNAQQVIEQHFLHKKKYDEIARDMGISRFAVYKHMTQGMRQLRAHFAWYHLLVVLVFLSGAVFAVLMHFHRQKQVSPAAKPAIEQTTPPKVAPQTVRYEDATLEQILTDIAPYYKVELHFISDDARHLRLHYDWRQSEPLTDIVSTLNSFESIDIELRGNTLYVK